MNKINIAIALTLASLSMTNAMAAPRVPGSQRTPVTISSAKVEGMTSAFKGADVNGGTASLVRENGKNIIRLSSDFKIPASPAPHFQIVDGDGNVYLLQRLTIVGNKTHREVTLPKYIKSVAKVQIWCAFAEVVLGEASFDETISLSQ